MTSGATGIGTFRNELAYAGMKTVARLVMRMCVMAFADCGPPTCGG
jgi:hypothetical protein